MLYPIYGSGKPGQIAYGDWCVTAAGASPSSDVTLVECSDDAAQIWNVTEYDTIENADGKCITFGKAALGAPVRSQNAMTEPFELMRNCRPLCRTVSLSSRVCSSGTRRSLSTRVELECGDAESSGPFHDCHGLVMDTLPLTYLFRFSSIGLSFQLYIRSVSVSAQDFVEPVPLQAIIEAEAPCKLV